MTPEAMIKLANSLEEKAQDIDRSMRMIESKAKATTWNGGARRRFDAELQTQLKQGKELSRDLLNAARELREVTGKYRAILAGLTRDEARVRKAIPELMSKQKLGGPVRGEATGHLPRPQDPRWADLALQILKHSAAVEAGLRR